MKKISTKGYNLLTKSELDLIEDKIKDYQEIQIYTDASSFPNPGVTGASLVIFSDDKELYYMKFAWPHSTNNRGELFALILAKMIINEFRGKNIVVYSDSQYSIGCIDGKGGANRDLLEKASSMPSAGDRIRKVKAHTKQQDTISLNNERADELANEARLSLEEELRKNKKTISEKQQEETIRELEETILKMRDEIIELKNKLKQK